MDQRCVGDPSPPWLGSSGSDGLIIGGFRRHLTVNLGIAAFWIVEGSCARLQQVRRLLILISLILASFLLAGAAGAEELPPGGSFIDDDGDIFEPSIEAIYAEGITVGCSSRAQFCPDRGVTRGEMAAFLARALDLATTDVDHFIDDDSSIFEADINRIAAVGITKGCNPPDNTRFCPDNVITRGEMAAFVVRAFQLEAAIQEDHFVDDDSSIFEAQIDSLAEAGITYGCNPPDNTWYCPKELVSRGAMAAFLTRAIPLESITPPPRPPTHLVSRFTTYHSCCEPRVTNIHVMARELDGWIVLPGETFELWDVIGPPRESEGYVPAPILLNGEGYCCDHPLNIGGGTSQFGTTLYNAVYWGAYDEVKHKPHSKYISRYPVGVEATLGYPDLTVDFVNDTWNPIYINTSYTSTSITVEFWGNNDGRTVVGWHSGGSTTIRVTKSGGDDARRVTSSVNGPVPGTVTIKRTISGPDGTSTETWYHTYID